MVAVMEVVVAEEVFTGVAASAAEATTAAMAAPAAAIRRAAIAASDEEIPTEATALTEACAAVRHRPAAPPHPGLGPGKAAVPTIARRDGTRLPARPTDWAIVQAVQATAAAWRRLTTRAWLTVNFTPSEETAVLLFAARASAAASAGVADGVTLAGAGVVAAGDGAGAWASVGVGAGIPSGIGPHMRIRTGRGGTRLTTHNSHPARDARRRMVAAPRFRCGFFC